MVFMDKQLHRQWRTQLFLEEGLINPNNLQEFRRE